jgi:hypothetical protein
LDCVLFADTVDMDPLREVDVDQEKMRKISAAR